MKNNILVFNNIAELITLENAQKKDGRHLIDSDLSIIKNACLVCDQENILWSGECNQLPEEYKSLPAIDCKNKIILPELVDAHSHLVFAGNRAKEYSMRLNGATYEEIASSGGGILHTMTQTNQSSPQTLFDTALKRIEKIATYGVGTIEIKSGYGLNFEKEYEISKVIDSLKHHLKNKIQIKNTYMAAHAVPKTFSRSSDYISGMVIPLLEKLSREKLIDACDIFHEKNYFSEEDVHALFKKCQELKIAVKMHADELNDNNGAQLAVSYNALSCDHLLKINESGVKALAASNTVAVLLPGTGFFLGKEQTNARKLCDHGVKLAIASDYNPGSCHYDNLFQIALMSAPSYKLNRAELIAAITLNASAALDLGKQGCLISGFKSRFSLFDCNNLDELIYRWGENLFFKHSSDFFQ